MGEEKGFTEVEGVNKEGKGEGEGMGMGIKGWEGSCGKVGGEGSGGNTAV